MSDKVYKTKQTKNSFPEWYYDAFWTHMILIEIDDNTYKLIPPNQMDWHITMRFRDTSWYIQGIRQNYDIEEFFEQKYMCI